MYTYIHSFQELRRFPTWRSIEAKCCMSCILGFLVFVNTAIWAAIPTHTSRAVSVLCNSRCWKKPSAFACLSTFARKISSASWWSSPRACPSKIRTKSTMVWKEKIYLSCSGGERTRSGGERTLWRAPYFDQLAQFRPRAWRAHHKTSLVWPWAGAITHESLSI